MSDKIEVEKHTSEKIESTWTSDVESKGETDDTFVPPDAEEMRKLRWKLDLRIVPWLGVLYLCSFLDRVNIGNAKLAGIQTDLQVSDDAYNWALSIFFIGYIIFEIPSNMMMKKIGPNKWIPLVMIAWGVTMCAMGALTNTAGLLASRFFLGITEAGLFPGAIYYLSLWFTRQEQATRVAIFFSCATVAGAFGGVLAYGIMQMDGIRDMRGWQWIFIIEAIPTILLSVATYFILPDLPHRAKFINERERAIVLNRLTVDAGPSTETHFSWKQFFAAFTDWKVYMHSLIYICGSTPLYSLSLFLPSIIKGMGYTDLAAQAMSAPPYAIACVFTIAIALHADKKRERGFHIAAPAFVGMIGYLLLVVLKDRGAVAMFIAAIITTTGVFAHIPAMLSWFTNNIGGHTKRGVASAFIISIGNVGGAIGGQIYRADDAPYYSRGHEICLGLMAGAWILSLLFKYLLEKENKRRDNLTPEQREKEASGEDLCDLHPDFRYIS
ncbi:major facilitator superfamily domain-containing protein [Absidia repens]|uniref:Major facilitator superfamily domain-containing protein n=1 Tax=Absidia repens TaxID=90262 RepID=A0A1X2IY93_9FUNG|nr:major facilitator superfamily domain-containing protein [Absidia repens]